MRTGTLSAVKLRRFLAATLATTVAFALAGLAVPAGAFVPGGKQAAVEDPTVTGPVTGGGGKPILVAGGDLSGVGYVTEEFFLEGDATSYAPKGKLESDGKWKMKTADTAPYTTRMVVYRPESAAAFDGTVFVEWLNVSSGFDSGADWIMGHTQMIRAGAAWVGISALAVGVQGGRKTVSDFVAPGGIKANDPERYAALTHPGDDYSYDIFSQAGVAVRNTGPVKPLGDVKVERVIAIGDSGAAFRLVAYINGVHPLAKVYDGFLVHSRSAGSAGFKTSDKYGFDDKRIPDSVITRRDIDVPVITLQTESDLTLLGYLATTERDAKNFRLWEVAGSSHADAYTSGGAFSDSDQGEAESSLLDPAQATVGPLSCAEPINSGPMFAVLNAALFQLERWVRDGTPAPKAPRLETTRNGKDIKRDEHDIARGGIRTPLVDVPIATNSGAKNRGGSFCSLFGRTVPFDAATLADLYPTHDAYVEAFDASADEAVKAGFWTEIDAEQFKAAAAGLAIPR